MLHVQGGMLPKVDQTDVAQLVPIMVHSGRVHWAQLQLLPFQVDLSADKGEVRLQREHVAALQTRVRLQMLYMAALQTI